MNYQNVRLFRFATLIVGALVFAMPSFAEGERRSDRADLFSLSTYREHVAHLASDELEGRGTGQPGIDKAAEYIADYFRENGVKPAGEDGTYFQDFSLNLKKEIGRGTRLAYRGGDRRTFRNFKLDHDYRPLPFSTSGDLKGGVVFAGYGIVDEDAGYNDYDGLVVAGKIVLVLRHTPKFRDFDQELESFRSKSREASDRNAAGLLVVNRGGDSDAPLYDFDTQDRFGGFRMRPYDLPMIHITQDAANKLLSAAGMPGIDELQQRIEKKRRPASAMLEGVSLKGSVDIDPVKTPARNVIGLIRGAGPQADEMIVLGAHYDHLGIRHKGEPDFDSSKHIYNGADDNASGTALIMAMAKAYSKGQRPNRSILLMLYSAEELGLLGSEHFANHPTVDIKKCVAMLNFDMVGRLKDDALEVGGMRTGGFESLVEDAAGRYGLKIKDGGGGRGPSDHTSFYNQNIPVLFFFTGLHRQYHQPEDDIALVNSDGAMRIARLASDIIDEIDAKASRPKFSADNRSPVLTRQRERAEDEKPVAGRPSQQIAKKGVRLGIIPEDGENEGLVVASVAENSAAAKADIRKGDRIVRIGPARVRNLNDAMAVLKEIAAGDEVTVRVVREGKGKRIRVRFDGERRAQVEGGEKKTWQDELGEAIRGIQTQVNIKTGTIVTSPRGKNGFEARIEFESASDWQKILGRVANVLEVELARGTAGKKNLKIVLDVNKPDDEGWSIQFSLSTQKGSESSAEKQPGPHGEKTSASEKRGADPHGDSHGQTGNSNSDANETPTMPRVRLGIMPTYGESEGEGYPITGVVEGGAAAKGGMKDTDRIFKIGTAEITSVYDYMEALRPYKPGDVIPIVVIRDGKKITLKIMAGRPEKKEAA